tara:strand:+ start:84 stop:1778 length:1695 start_codon:yes stop_codon:yes gene_type:complete
MVGYSDVESGFIYSEFIDITNELKYECVNNALDIRTALNGSDWDAIISNHSMPSFNCMDTLHLLKESGRDIPFIVYASSINEEVAISAMNSGADDCVQKDNIKRLLFSIERELKNVVLRRAKLQAESQIYRLEYYDDLTGLPKRSLFCEKVSRILSERPDPEAIAAIYCFTFDRLPYINSTYGYNIGDILIQQLSFRLSVYTGRNCLLTRIEGSKFAFFNGDLINADDIQMFSDRIMRLASTPFVIDSLEFYVTLNMGICIYPTDGKDVLMLLANAESTLSFSKDFWRNNCHYYLREIGEAASRHMKLEGSLRRAIKKEELLLHYQPIVDLQTGSITGAEALVHWNHPEFGLLSPDKFISLAHETGLIIDIGKWVLWQACKQVKSWHDAGFSSMSIAVNISAIELEQSQLLNHVSIVLDETGLPPDFLELEITETVLMQDAETGIKALQGLKSLGVKIAVDDFGTGYSSLSYLKRFPIDVLKIDKSFARDIVLNPDSSVIVTAIIALAGNLDLSVIAKGVETKEQFDLLYHEHCDRAQGSLFSKPVSAENLFHLLDQRKTGTLA